MFCGDEVKDCRWYTDTDFKGKGVWSIYIIDLGKGFSLLRRERIGEKFFLSRLRGM